VVIYSDRENIGDLESETERTAINKVMFYSIQQRIQCAVQLQLSIALPIARIHHNSFCNIADEGIMVLSRKGFNNCESPEMSQIGKLSAGVRKIPKNQ
jgi:hypothetical protein